uniref:Uncharacterized protein n=1 Tax=Rhizophora mucronata TaxID=61149 RepID=A0A2P2J0M1_RHIMU
MTWRPRQPDNLNFLARPCLLLILSSSF